MSGAAAAILILLPLSTTSLRFRDAAESHAEQLEFNALVGSTMAHDAGRWMKRRAPSNVTVNSTIEWPDGWLDAHEHGQAIAHNLDEDTLFNFLHAFSGPAATHYSAQTMALPAFGVPSLKMQRAVPGWDARTEEEATRVTAFPSYLALASSFDKDLITEVALAIGEEFKTLGANAMLGPAINIHRSTQHDQEFDSLSGEDPTLGSVLVRNWILAAQTHGIMSIPTHIGKAEQDPVHWENKVSNLTSWDIYYPPFETAIDCGAAGIMCASHEVNGLWSCRDKEMLERDLKDIMGFQGMVISDTASAREYFPYASSFEKGLDLMIDEPVILNRSKHMIAGMRRAAERTLAAIWHMRVEQNPGCEPPDCKETLSKVAFTQQHLDVAKKAAGSAIVLLKNDGVLPFSPNSITTIAVFGPAALRTWANTEYETPFHAIQAHGADKGIKVKSGPDDAQVCVVLGGNNANASHWLLSDDTIKAIQSSITTCPKTVVLLELSGTVLTPWREQVNGLATIFHAGEETAFGWAATIFGDASPAGKLPISFPDYQQDTPQWWTEAPPSYWDKDATFAYPFGHGLSYASFTYVDIKQKMKCRFPLCVMLTVRNDSPTYKGAEVVQVYFKFPDALGHPVVLRGFVKTAVLGPGESEKVFFPFTLRDVSLYRDINSEAEAEKSWVAQRSLTVLVGSSSKDIRLQLPVVPNLESEKKAAKSATGKAPRPTAAKPVMAKPAAEIPSKPRAAWVSK